MEKGDIFALTLGQKYQLFHAHEIERVQGAQGVQRVQGNEEYLKL
jgi:hypothetical protein